MDNQIEQLAKLHELYQKGILTEDEFKQKKAEMLNTTQKGEAFAQGGSKAVKSGNQSKPKLWNPNATTLWSLLFTPIFGSLLQNKNWEALGEQEKADNSKNWFYGVTKLNALDLMIMSGTLTNGVSNGLVTRFLC